MHYINRFNFGRFLTRRCTLQHQHFQRARRFCVHTHTSTHQEHNRNIHRASAQSQKPSPERALMRCNLTSHTDSQHTYVSFTSPHRLHHTGHSPQCSPTQLIGSDWCRTSLDAPLTNEQHRRKRRGACLHQLILLPQKVCCTILMFPCGAFSTIAAYSESATSYTWMKWASLLMPSPYNGFEVVGGGGRRGGKGAGGGERGSVSSHGSQDTGIASKKQLDVPGVQIAGAGTLLGRAIFCWYCANCSFSCRDCCSRCLFLWKEARMNALAMNRHSAPTAAASSMTISSWRASPEPSLSLVAGIANYTHIHTIAFEFMNLEQCYCSSRLRTLKGERQGKACTSKSYQSVEWHNSTIMHTVT